MSVSEAQHIKDQIRDNQDNLNSLPIVAEYSCDYIDTNVKNWRRNLRTEIIFFITILVQKLIEKDLAM